MKSAEARVIVFFTASVDRNHEAVEFGRRMVPGGEVSIVASRARASATPAGVDLILVSRPRIGLSELITAGELVRGGRRWALVIVPSDCRNLRFCRKIQLFVLTRLRYDAAVLYAGDGAVDSVRWRNLALVREALSWVFRIPAFFVVAVLGAGLMVGENLRVRRRDRRGMPGAYRGGPAR